MAEIQSSSSNVLNSPSKHRLFNSNERLGKKLMYLLRYAAEKEGLSIDSEGFVDFDELMHLPMLGFYTSEEVLQEIDTSISTVRNTKRFETKQINGVVYVRATYGHRLQRNPFHPNTKVRRLFESSLDSMCSFIQYYDFSDFPDSYILGILIRRLKDKNMLTNKNIRSLMVPALTHLDLYNAIINESTLKQIPKKCPNLTWLSFQSCGYLLTDLLLGQAVKGLQCLKSLNLLGCHHLTVCCLATIEKHCPDLIHLNLTGVNSLTADSIVHLITKLSKLEELHIYDYDETAHADWHGVNFIQEGRKFRFYTATPSTDQVNSFDSVWQRPNFR